MSEASALLAADNPSAIISKEGYAEEKTGFSIANLF